MRRFTGTAIRKKFEYELQVAAIRTNKIFPIVTLEQKVSAKITLRIFIIVPTVRSQCDFSRQNSIFLLIWATA